MERVEALMIPVVALMLLTTLNVSPIMADDAEPIIVCTTNVLGSLVQELAGRNVSVMVLAQPGICPADYDMKPSDVYAVSNAKLLFCHDIPGEFWLQSLIEASGNVDLTKVKIPGVYNTPEGAKRCIRWVGGNLSTVLSINLDTKVNAMIADVDATANAIQSEAQGLNVTAVKVACMKWQKAFVAWVGFNVVAEYNPPETLSASDITNLIDTARSEGAALIIDNLQVGVDFGAQVASEVGAMHVVLTNFPGAIPGTGNLTQMFSYNAEQLFEGTRAWRNTRELRGEMESLRNQLTIFQAMTSVAIIAAVAEAIWLYVGRKRTRALETRRVLPSKEPR
jgi:zinc/manganese transport system substrate-binding protein/zinc transport system substrate-binding protein